MNKTYCTNAEHNCGGAKLEVTHISKVFALSTEDDVKTALDNVSFSIKSGSCTVIGGANGSGKSVLMSIIAGLSKPSSGTIAITGDDSKPAKAGLVFQEADSQILGETPLEDVMFGAKNAGLSKADAQSAAENVLEKVGLKDKMNYPARFLSGGEKRRLAVAGILVMMRPLIIFDEPYANLDYDGIKQVNALIELLKSEKKTIIVLMHDIEKCLGLAGQFIVLHNGKKVFDGSADDGIKMNLSAWGIKNPPAGIQAADLVWR